MTARHEPKWLKIWAVKLAQRQEIEEWGGQHGVRDEGIPESALAHPINKFHYETAGWSELAAAYAFALCKNHAFVDGNKRVAIAAAGVFLDINGIEFNAPEPEVVVVTMAVAAGEMDEAALAAWFAEHIG